MSATAEGAAPPAAIRRPSTLSRVYGFGSVFGKTVRDGRWAIVGFAAVIALIELVTIVAYVGEFDTPLKRAALAGQMAALPPMFAGLLGPATNIETLAGFVSWRSLGFMPVIVGVWSIVALSGTIAGEAGRGSLELLLATPHRRASIAMQKVAAHVAALAVALGIAGVVTWAVMAAMAQLPGDAATLGAVLAMFLWIFLLALAGGAAAFAAGPFLTRSAAGGIGAALLFGTFIVNAYADLVPGFDVLQRLSMFDWTETFRPMVDSWDWLPLLGVAVLDLGLLGVGVAAFGRRDLGSTVHIREGGRNLLPVGLGGPIARSSAERLPIAIASGFGLGLFGLIIAMSADAFVTMINETEGFADLIAKFFPDLELTSAAGVLELYFVNFGTLVIGLLAAAVVAGWSSDERERRLDMILATQLPRVRWALSSGIGVFVGIAVIAGMLAIAISIGVLAMGDDPVAPIGGSLALGLFAAAFAGIGLAVGGLGWPALAGPIVAVLVFATYLLDFLGGILRLPDAIMQLSLVRHLGHPMTGDFDVPGLGLMAVLAIGGLLIGAWGVGRRDIGR
jgi:ABC-2 type transport system permease protein